MKKYKNENIQKLIVLEGFMQNGHYHRNQRIFLRRTSYVKIDFRVCCDNRIIGSPPPKDARRREGLPMIRFATGHVANRIIHMPPLRFRTHGTAAQGLSMIRKLPARNAKSAAGHRAD